MSVYADSSFFVSLYLSDQHSSRAELLLSSKPAVCVTPLHIAEWTHAIEQHVFRKGLLPQQAQRLHTRFAQDRSSQVWTPAAIPDLAYERCADLARQHAAHFGFRTLDSLHVAIALELNIGTFWTFDVRQQRLAQAVGLKSNRT